ncbi:MAG: cytochrome c [Chitinophagaceae bacterium]
MKRIILFAASLCMLLTACQQTGKKLNSLLNKSLLPSQVFTINIDRDTTLKTANGAFISIPQGALSGVDGATVQLELKEAYTIEQIVKAGLTTQSNGQPLSSGGMIYINAIGGKPIKIAKALSIKIPTPSLDKRMQLFKGDTDRNGNINWVKPESLPANAQANTFNVGKALFSNNCASCHSIGKDGTGPDLAHILARTPDKKQLYAFTRNSQLAMTHTEDPYYRCLWYSRGKSAMNTFDALTDQDLDDLYGYIENESKVRGLAMPQDNIRPFIDSCIKYWNIKTRLEEMKGKLSAEKMSMVLQEYNFAEPSLITPIDTTVPPIQPLPSSVNKVFPIYNESLYYQFNIDTFGWFNIDHLLDDSEAVESNLTVRIIGEYKQNINLYLAIPAKKIFTDGGLLEGKADVYGFYSTDGKIRLPLNTKAYIFAVGEYEDKIIYAKKEFKTATSQDFEMSLSIVTKDFFNASIKELGLSDLKFSAQDTKNADTLRKVIKDLKDVEKLKPQHCDCNCINNNEKDYYYPETDTSYSVPKK